MDMDETVIYVNKRLKEGYSIAKVERELKYGKDTLRKKLNRANYFFNKEQNQFIITNTNVTQSITQTEKHVENKPITQNATHSITQSNSSNKANHSTTEPITQTSNTTATQSKQKVITQGHNTKVTQPRALTDEDFQIIFKLIDEYKARVEINEKPIEIPKDDAVVTRSMRSYDSVFKSFSKYCKDNKIVQQDAIAEALLRYISK